MQANIRFEKPTNRPASEGTSHLPVLLLALALVIWFGFQLFQTLKTREGLISAYDNQEPQVQTANKIRASLSALASSTKQLANQGNPNAAQIVKALAQRGINISDPKLPPEQPAKAKDGQAEVQPPK